MTTNTRREFIRKSALLAVASPMVLATTSERSFAQLPTKSLDETSAQAVALGYVHDATKADTTKFPKRKGPEGEKQFCNNCVLLLQSGVKLEGKEGEWGKCAIFIDGLVNSKGWCNSWAPKA
jgi:High potential iron-sulfur protein